MVAPLNLTKQDVSLRQVETAIELFAQENDPVSIYTLTMAAFGVLRDLAQHHDDSTLLDEIEATILPGKQDAYWALFRRPANFMKHADRDPIGVLEDFRPEINEGMLIVCTILLMERGFSNRGPLLAFMAWFTAMHPEFVKEPASQGTRSDASKMFETARKLMESESRTESLELLRRVLRLFDAVGEG